MTGKRKLPDPLARARLYVRSGKRITTFYVKNEDNTNTTLVRVRSDDKDALRIARREAETKYDESNSTTSAPHNLKWLSGEYFKWQGHLPPQQRKAASTIAENERESKNLCLFFGNMMPDAIQPHHCYTYIDARTKATGAAVKAGKEISLLSAMLEYGRRIGVVRENTAKGIEKPRNPPKQTLVTWQHIEILTEAGRKVGSSLLVAALAARFAWLTIRRPDEVRSFTDRQITNDGCVFTASKRRAVEAEKHGLIQWSPELRSTVDEALALKRWESSKNKDVVELFGNRLVFGNLAGERYTRSGWKTHWKRLWEKARDLANEKQLPWIKFSLQDCRPGGVTAKQERGDTDTMDGTLHSDGRMVAKVYDRRKVRKSTAAR